MDVNQNVLSDESMVSLDLSQFPTGSQLFTSVYLRISQNKYLQVGKQGQVSQFSSLHAFKDKKVDQVFILKKELSALTTHALQQIANPAAHSYESDEHFFDLKNTTNLVLKELLFLGVNPQTFENCKILSKSIRDLARQTPNVMSLVFRFKNMPGNFYQHSLAVSILSAMVGVEMGWASEGVLEKLTLGGLLHDIGLQQLPQQLLTKSLQDMSSDEKLAYETHPYLGAQMLKAIPNIPPEISRIVYEHHESSFGDGYPRGMVDAEISPHSKVIALVDQFTELVMPQMPGQEPLKSEQALNYIVNVLGQPFNQECFKAFKAIFGK